MRLFSRFSKVSASALMSGMLMMGTAAQAAAQTASRAQPQQAQASPATPQDYRQTHIGPLSPPSFKSETPEQDVKGLLNLTEGETFWIPKEAPNVLTQTFGSNESTLIFPDDQGRILLPKGTLIVNAQGQTRPAPEGLYLIPPSPPIEQVVPDRSFDLVHVLPALDQINSHGKNLRPGFIFLDSDMLAADKNGRTYNSSAFVALYDDASVIRMDTTNYLNRDLPGRIESGGRLVDNIALRALTASTKHITMSHNAEMWMFGVGEHMARLVHLTQTQANPFTTLEEYRAVVEEIRAGEAAFAKANPNATPQALREEKLRIMDAIRTRAQQEAQRPAQTPAQTPAQAPTPAPGPG